MKTKAPSSEGRFAYQGLDRVIHERARLSVLTSLISSPKGVTFGQLKQLCSLTDGNLSRHLRVLENAKMVEIAKPRAGGARCGKGNDGTRGTRTFAITGLIFL